MNDAGLDGPIENASSQVQNVYSASSHASSKDDDQAIGTSRPNAQLSHAQRYQSPAYSTEEQFGGAATELPTKWWYASTGFPLIAGTFGPMANTFSICALVENWRVEVPPGGTEEHGIDIPDPRWLIAVNAVSLVFALIANLSLLLNMAKRIPFRFAQPVTISGFWMSSVLLTVLVGYAAHDFHKEGVQKQALTQAYYYGCWAAGLYQLISLMMCVTVYGAVTARYPSEFNLTMAQRTLMLQTISLLTYMLLGALVYSKIESWRFLDAVYWADFTLLTVGIGGDMTPTTHLGRSLLFPYSIGGIVILGLVVSSIRTMVLDRGKQNLHARMTEKMRRKLVKQVDQVYTKGKTQRGQVTGLSKSHVKQLTLSPRDDPDEEFDRRRAEFKAMRRVQEMTSQRQKWMNLVLSTSAFAILWFVGAVIFWQTEGRNQGWSYFIALYFSWTSLLTIGYGDFIPLSNAGRSFFVFWSLLAVPSLTILISDMGDTVVKVIKDATLWFGEITILPSNQGSIMERLRYGISKVLSTPLPLPRDRKDKNTYTKTDRNRDVEKKDDDDGDKARKLDHALQDEHHYHRTLIAEIRSVYRDSNLPNPKHYTYDEWAYFLRLLGEDESSSDFHRHAPVKAHKKHEQFHHDQNSSEEGSDTSQTQNQNRGQITQWSWIGPKSPLMLKGEQSEPQWLIARLFDQLEHSVRESHQGKERACALAGDNGQTR